MRAQHNAAETTHVAGRGEMSEQTGNNGRKRGIHANKSKMRNINVMRGQRW